MEDSTINNNSVKNDFFNIKYKLTGQEVKEGLLLLQKKYFYKKYIIYSILFFIIFVNYLFVFIESPANVLSFILMIISILGIGFLWFNLYNQRRSASKAVELLDCDFDIQIYSDRLEVNTVEQKEIYSYLDDKIEVIDDINKFIISVGKEKIYIIPKRYIDNYVIEKVRNIFKDNLDYRYYSV